MNSIIKDYLTFSRREQRGIFVLFIITMVIIGYNLLLPGMVPIRNYDISEFNQEMEQFTYMQKKRQDSLDSLKKKTKKYQARKTYYPKQRKKPIQPIEINGADSSGLTEIRGIGPVFASRIVKYRNMLGGFYCKEQLLEVYGIDHENFSYISTQIEVDSTKINKIDINNIKFKELLKHPYLNYDDVKAVFKCRDKTGNRVTKSLLIKSRGLEQESLEKILPYISF